jgi:RNA polymerase sigma-70 factor (ECF subfamily)
MERWHDDPLAFEALVRRWERPVARILARLVGRADQVADLSQEVFLRLYHARARYRENGKLAGWIYKITLNVAHDAGRRRRRAPVPLAGHEPLDPAAPAAALCQKREEAAAVTRALAELPEPQRVVLVLRHYEGMSFEEIARLTGTPATTLKSRFAAALTRLRARLEELGWRPDEDPS